MTRQPTESHWHYQVYGRRLCSSLPLPMLPRFSFEARDVVFRYLSPGDPPDLTFWNARLLTRRSTNLDCDLSLYRTLTGYLMRWEGQCDFLLGEDGRDIQCIPFLDTDVLWVQETLYNMILSFALFLNGVSNFHASAVVLPQGVVGFMADPGSGKSTLAAGFAAAGFPFLTDDVLAVVEEAGQLHGFPGFPHVSISSKAVDGLFGRRDDFPVVFHNGEKQRVAVANLGVDFSAQPVPLKALFMLRRGCPGTDIRLEHLPRVSAVRGLLEHTNCLPLLPKKVLQTHLAFVEHMTATIPVCLLHYPSGLENVPRVIAAVAEQVRWLAETAVHGAEPVGARKADSQ